MNNYVELAGVDGSHQIAAHPPEDSSCLAGCPPQPASAAVRARLQSRRRLSQRAGIPIGERVRSQMWSSAEQVAKPFMIKGGVTGRVGDDQHRGAPLGTLADLADPGIDDVDHQIEQFGSVDHIVVEPHRTDTELFGDLANRQAIEAVRVGKPDRHSGEEHLAGPLPQAIGLPFEWVCGGYYRVG